MLIKSTYDVTDQGSFNEAARRAPQLPQGVEVVALIPSLDHSHITVLWKADSVESVQSYVDAIVGATANSVYHPVDEQYLRGLG